MARFPFLVILVLCAGHLFVLGPKSLQQRLPMGIRTFPISLEAITADSDVLGPLIVDTKCSSRLSEGIVLTNADCGLNEDRLAAAKAILLIGEVNRNKVPRFIPTLRIEAGEAEALLEAKTPALVRISFEATDYSRHLRGHDECAEGCTTQMLRDLRCHPSCDNASCYYNNWQCRCAAKCPVSQLGDGVCEEDCNNELCNYDNGDCSPAGDSTSSDNSSGDSSSDSTSSDDSSSDSTSSDDSPTVDNSGGSVTVTINEGGDSSSHAGSAMVLGAAVISGGLCCLMISIALFVITLKRLRKRRNVVVLATMHVPVSVPAPVVSDRAQNPLIPEGGRVNYSPKLVEFGETTCTICLSDFRLTEEVVKTLCRHLFHYSCLAAWLQHHLDCPVCKKHLVQILNEVPTFIGPRPAWQAS